MTKKLESGKSRLVKGSLLFLWEELKSMNRIKLRALFWILSGHIRMKNTKRRNLNLSLDEN
jgi:hypothetical protein